MKIWILIQIEPVQCRRENKEKNPCDLSSSHQTRSYQTNTTTKSNKYISKYIRKLILSASHSIFHSFTASLISVCFVVMKNFFNRYIKKLSKSRNHWLLIYRLLHYFPVFSKNSIWYNVTSSPPQHTIGY